MKNETLYCLQRYIYVPTIKALDSLTCTELLAEEIKKLIASLGTFMYVYVWHTITFEMFVWASCNFLGITLERIGSLIKRKVDKKLVSKDDLLFSCSRLGQGDNPIPLNMKNTDYKKTIFNLFRLFNQLYGISLWNLL